MSASWNYNNCEEVEIKLTIHKELFLSLVSGFSHEFSRERIKVECYHKNKLKKILQETIEQLEKTRSSFKSKQIENLRKQLMQYLDEES